MSSETITRLNGTGRGVEVLSPRRRTLAFAGLLFAFVLEIADSTIVNTALPTIQADLAASGSALQWVIAGYFLSFAVLLVAGGRLGDLYGYRRMFLLGAVGFTGASLACGLARGGVELAGFRIAQGAAAAMMAPQVIALVQIMFSPLERVSRLAIFGIVGGLAAIGGPIVGGLLIQADVAGWGWRLIFFVNLPIGAAAITAGWVLLPEGRSPHPLRLDPGGTVWLATALVALLAPLIEGRALGWPWWCWASLAAFPVLLRTFWRHAVRRARRVGSALIAPELFAERRFALGLAMTLLFAVACSGFPLVLSLTLQQGLGYTPLQTALVHMPFGLGVMAGIGGIGPRALPRLGRWLPVGGAVAMACGCSGAAAAVAFAPGSSIVLIVALMIAGVGMGSVAGPLGPITLARVDKGHAGVAGGMQNGVQQVGGALGSATIGTLYFAYAESGAPAAFAGAVAVVALLLAAVAALSGRLPTPLFDHESPSPDHYE